MPLLVVDLYREPGRSFRVIPSEMWSVENNLSLSNMDFFEFADSVDPDGVFRGFPIPVPRTPEEEQAKRAAEERELYGDRIPNGRLRVAAWAAVRALERYREAFAAVRHAFPQLYS